MTEIFLTVLDMSLAASAVIAVVLIARLLLAKQPKIFSYVLWLAVLLRLLCPVSFSAPVSVVEATAPRVAAVSENTTSVHYLPEIGSDPEASELSPPEAPEQKGSVLTLAAYGWLFGAGFLVLGSLLSYGKLRRALVGAVPLEGRVFLADHIPTPFVLGIFRPKIYLPSHTSEEERRFILAHEVHHIRRLDPVTRVLAYAALCLHWFNPLVWAAFRLSGKDMEMSCDEAVIRKLGEQSRADYAGTLLRLTVRRSVFSGAPLAFGEGDTGSRVRNLALWRRPQIWAVLICAVLCAGCLFLCAGNPEVQEAAISLEQCRSALESLKGADYHVKLYRSRYGAGSIQDTRTQYHYFSGEDWLQVDNPAARDAYAEVVSEGIPFRALYRGGEYYNNIGSEFDRLTFVSDDRPYQSSVWLHRFAWEDQEISYVSTAPAGKGQCITLQVMAPYDANLSDTYDYYYVNFIFDEKAVFQRVEITTYSFSERYGDYSIQETIVLLGSGFSREEIESAYRSAEKE